MALWDVSGADASTGEEQIFRIEASTALSAETKARSMGLLVSNVAPVDPMEAIAAASRSTPRSSGRHMAGARSSPAVPSYTGIVIAAVVLRILAGVAGAIALFLILAAVTGMAGLTTSARPSPGPYSPASPSNAIAGTVFIATLISANAPLIVAVFLYAIAELCLAVRDIARNSFLK